MSHTRRNELVLFGVCLVLSVLVILAWYQPLNYHVFVGDDLLSIEQYNSGATSSGFWHSFLTLGNEIGKFRPISNALILAVSARCRNSFDCYVAANSLILAINALLISFAAYNLSQKWWPSIFSSALVLIVSRFAYYAVLQVAGLMENLSLALVLLFTISAANFIRGPNLKWSFATIAFYGLATGSHERFMVLLAPLLFALWLERRHLTRFVYVASLAVALLLTGGYLLLKQFVFHSSILTGAGATSVLQTFQLSQFFLFVGQAVLNLFGFNAGTQNFSGKYFLDAGPAGIGLGVLLSGALAALVFVLIRQKSREFPRTPRDLSLFLAVAVAALVISSSITYRQEYRWLFAPFVVFVLLVFLLVGYISSTSARWLLTGLITVLFVSVDLFYRPYIGENVYFLTSSRLASSAKGVIIDGSKPYALSHRDFYIITTGSSVVQDWILQGDYFFKLYSHTPEIRVHYINDIDSLPAKNTGYGDPLVYDIHGTHVVKVPPEIVQGILSDKQAFQSAFVVEYDFLAGFQSGSAETTTAPAASQVPAPFLRYWSDQDGIARQAMTIGNPYSVHFAPVKCEPNSTLIFRAAMPYAAGDGADLRVEEENQGIQQRVVQIALRPAAVDSVMTWQEFSVPVPGCSGAPVDFVFGVDSPSGDNTWDWIALANLRLVTPK